MGNENHSPNMVSLEDVGGYLKSCSDTFAQIRVILKAAEQQAAAHSDLRRLLEAAHYLACDSGGLAGRWSEEVLSHGVRND